MPSTATTLGVEGADANYMLYRVGDGDAGMGIGEVGLQEYERARHPY